jgi:hypothetical protein
MWTRCPGTGEPFADDTMVLPRGRHCKWNIPRPAPHSSVPVRERHRSTGPGVVHMNHPDRREGAGNALGVAWNTHYTPTDPGLPCDRMGGTAPPTRHQQWDSFGAFGFWCRTIPMVGK